MKFDVVFQSGLWGKGLIHLNDIGLLCEGAGVRGGISSFGIFGAGLGSGEMQVRTARTIPYSTILTSKKIGVLSRYYLIEYRLPNGARVKMKFTLVKPKTGAGQEFGDCIEQMRNSTRLLSGA